MRTRLRPGVKSAWGKCVALSHGPGLANLWTLVIMLKFRLSSHKFLIERARWHKTVIPYHERTCTLCNKHDIQDEYHVALICEYFKNIREKYIKPYYYTRPSMIKFIELMNTPNSKERFRMMLFLKIVFKLYAETLKQ